MIRNSNKFFDSHGALWIECTVDDPGAVPFGPNGISRPATPEEVCGEFGSVDWSKTTPWSVAQLRKRLSDECHGWYFLEPLHWLHREPGYIPSGELGEIYHRRGGRPVVQVWTASKGDPDDRDDDIVFLYDTNNGLVFSNGLAFVAGSAEEAVGFIVHENRRRS